MVDRSTSQCLWGFDFIPIKVDKITQGDNAVGMIVQQNSLGDVFAQILSHNQEEKEKEKENNVHNIDDDATSVLGIIPADSIRERNDDFSIVGRSLTERNKVKENVTGSTALSNDSRKKSKIKRMGGSNDSSSDESYDSDKEQMRAEREGSRVTATAESPSVKFLLQNGKINSSTSDASDSSDSSDSSDTSTSSSGEDESSDEDEKIDGKNGDGKIISSGMISKGSNSDAEASSLDDDNVDVDEDDYDYDDKEGKDNEMPENLAVGVTEDWSEEETSSSEDENESQTINQNIKIYTIGGQKDDEGGSEDGVLEMGEDNSDEEITQGVQVDAEEEGEDEEEDENEEDDNEEEDDDDEKEEEEEVVGDKEDEKEERESLIDERVQDSDKFQDEKVLEELEEDTDDDTEEEEREDEERVVAKQNLPGFSLRDLITEHSSNSSKVSLRKKSSKTAETGLGIVSISKEGFSNSSKVLMKEKWSRGSLHRILPRTTIQLG